MGWGREGRGVPPLLSLHFKHWVQLHVYRGYTFTPKISQPRDRRILLKFGRVVPYGSPETTMVEIHLPWHPRWRSGWTALNYRPPHIVQFRSHLVQSLITSQPIDCKRSRSKVQTSRSQRDVTYRCSKTL